MDNYNDADGTPAEGASSALSLTVTVLPDPRRIPIAERWKTRPALDVPEDAPWRVRTARPSLEDLRSVFREHLYLPDTASVDFTAAVMVANRQPSDPVWGLIVGPPGSGKTETVESRE